MGLSDITGVFSRYFVVGFFMPAYVSLIVLWVAASPAFVPDTLQENHSQATQVLILGAAALVIALALSGLSYYITRIYEGYPLVRVRNSRVVKLIYKAAIGLQGRRYDRLCSIRDDAKSTQEDVNRAALSLDRWYPEERGDLLPTRLGNAIRAFEQHSNVRWGLDGVTIWPRIEALLSSDERELEVDAKINVYVFLNGSVGALAVGICLVVDQAVYHARPTWAWGFLAIPFVAWYALYRASVGPAIEWGSFVRSSIDLHRLDLYTKLGVRAPKSFTDERKMAVKINQTLLYGVPLPDDLSVGAQAVGHEAGGGVLGRLARCKNKEAEK